MSDEKTKALADAIETLAGRVRAARELCGDPTDGACVQAMKWLAEDYAALAAIWQDMKPDEDSG